MIDLHTAGLITLCFSLCLLWAITVIWIGKKMVGKDASGIQIIFFLTMAGPCGWTIIVIIFLYDIVDHLYNKIFHKNN
jgi:TRAP-type C4-dicarboxylate transport system permease small subunit